MGIELRVSAGELIDRVTILELKRARLPAAVRAEIERDLGRLQGVRERELPVSPRLCALEAALAAANEELWELEESLRECERAGVFDEHFVALARQVYLTNDRRAALKRGIDALVGSEVREHKSHALPSV
jgi:hypothetical protein